MSLFHSEFNFSSELFRAYNDPLYFVEAQILHCHGFDQERHNVHTKRYKFMMPALKKYYKDV
jgi:hypothetical protein